MSTSTGAVALQDSRDRALDPVLGLARAAVQRDVDGEAEPAMAKEKRTGKKETQQRNKGKKMMKKEKKKKKTKEEAEEQTIPSPARAGAQQRLRGGHDVADVEHLRDRHGDDGQALQHAEARRHVQRVHLLLLQA